MRAIGFFIVIIFSLYPFRLQEISHQDHHGVFNYEVAFEFRHPGSGMRPSLALSNHKNAIDTNQLKQTDWYSSAIRQINESEYNIGAAGEGSYGSPNRQQNLRAFYTADRFKLEPRTGEPWTLQLLVEGVYTGQKKLYATQDDAPATTSKNQIRFNHNNEFTVEYINSKEGVRQNFIIEKKPFNNPKTLAVRLTVGRNWFVNRVGPNEIHFAKTNSGRLEKKITYNSLKAWDATGKELDAYFSVDKNEVSVNVNTGQAVYPLTIDPLSTGTNGSADWVGDDANQPSGFFGYSVASAGDVNGDGYSDVIIGCYGYDTPFTVNEGQAFVYYGSATGLSTTPDSTPDDADQNGALFGRSVACAGDVNGDGFSDVIIGADMYDDAPFTNEGRAYIYYGSASGLAGLYGSTLRDADQTAAQFGFSVAGAGDVNGDGYSDVMVGAYVYDDGPNANEGKVFVYHGSAAGLITTVASTPDDCDQADAQFGCTINSAGDVNGDGFSDIVIGAFLYDDAGTDEGQAYVYYGSATGLASTPDRILSDANMGDAQFGFSVASAGDVNGDGYSDVIVGANEFDDGVNANEGIAFIYYGSSSGLSATYNSIADDANQANANFGGRVACAGDVNGDGFADVIIGAYTYDDNLADEGVAFVYYGGNTGLSASPDCMLDDSNLSGASFGYSVASAGDVNGDGFSDVIIGAYTYNYMGNIDYGLAYVYHGAAGGLSASPVNTPDDANQAQAQFGVSVACAGDVNADGFSDVIVGAWLFDDGASTDEGRAFVYHGSASGLSATPNSILDDADQAGCFFGETVAPAGDVNGDGYGDVIIGADNYDDAGNNNEGRAFVYHGSAGGLSATPNSILDDANQASAFFGVSVAAAGDINGDGYGEVIVGAIGMQDGANVNEGKAFVYYGSISGLASTPGDTLDDADQASAYFGWSVAGAGDVNGDGFGDVIIGAIDYDDGANTNEGRAFVYHGSSIGLSATPDSTPDDANQLNAQFGECVAAAGDVNGDGFSDVIIGSKSYDDGASTDEGRAFIYHGSSTGLSASPNSTPDDADQSFASFGISVASAGDVNGDGYSDVIIGARWYDDGANPDEGRAYVYHGSASGISTAPNSTLDDADQLAAYFGYSVATAGDINGDGYSDVIVGAYTWDDGASTNEGGAFIYYGNSAGGQRSNLRLYNSDLITPIQQSNMSDPNLFGAGLFAKSSLGRQKTKMVWETVRNGNAFSGSPITNSTAFTVQQTGWTDPGLTGIELKNQIAKMIPTKATYIRARVKYDPVTALTGQVYGPWRYPESFLRGRREIGAVALPVKFISFTAIKQNETVLLKWITTGEAAGLRYEIQHSTDGQHFNTLHTLTAFQTAYNIYDWTHTNPAKAKNYYRIRAVEDDKETLTPTRMVAFNSNVDLVLYPSPVHSGGELYINYSVLPVTFRTIQLSDSKGRLIASFGFQPGNTTKIRLPGIPAGQYLLSVMDGKNRLASEWVQVTR